MKRRFFLQSSVYAAGHLAAARAPGIITSERLRPALPCGVQSGDVDAQRAIIWARADRRARMIVEYATTESFRRVSRIAGPVAHEATDFTARVDLRDLPRGQRIFYRVKFEDLRDRKLASDHVGGTLRTPPAMRRDVLFAWSGDTAGQGWGINADWGGMKIFEAIRQLNPDFFVHSGDTIYADGPLQAEVKLDDGSLWKNIVTPEKAKVAETLTSFAASIATSA
ncbi:MAG: PhoD-like phosphatase N-terminal domain-containing protein [Pyrinomonadaceae bacterium]